MFAVSRLLTSNEGTPESRISTMISGLFEAMQRHEHLFAAMLEARATSQPVRDMWDADRLSFVEPLAEMIRAERASGTRPRGPRRRRACHGAARAQRQGPRACGARRDAAPSSEQVEAVTTIWLRTIYGTVDMSATKHDEITFVSQGVECAAWHFTAAGDALATPAGRPVVVMAHGLAGTVDSGLAPFAERLAGVGLDVLAFDYRGFGASGGRPRQTVSIAGQVEDYRAAMTAAAALPGVDPQRLVLWGVSLSGGHVLEAAADRPDVAAVVSLTPLVDGLAAGRHALASHQPSEMARSTLAGLRSRVSAAVGRPPVMMPVVARPGEMGALTLEGSYEDYLAMAGPTWRNEIDASMGFELGNQRATKAADRVTAPVLVQIADLDRSAPPHAAGKAAVKARAEVRHYPCDHFDVWPGKPWFEPAAAHQVAFLVRHLA